MCMYATSILLAILRTDLEIDWIMAWIWLMSCTLDSGAIEVTDYN